MIRAIALGYHVTLVRSRNEALSVRSQLEALSSSDPRDPEAIAALGSWHINAVSELGSLMGAAVLGASKVRGLTLLDRAVVLGGKRAMFAGLAALLRLQVDANDTKARALAENALRAETPTSLDQVMKQAAAAILVPLRAGNGRQAQALAKLWLPLGRVPR